MGLRRNNESTDGVNQQSFMRDSAMDRFPNRRFATTRADEKSEFCYASRHCLQFACRHCLQFEGIFFSPWKSGFDGVGFSISSSRKQKGGIAPDSDEGGGR
ncbi:hypothetical protein L1987_17213 [Smallanthus sonchifolius]|uniref:Uncharacterized protein n=1 Tax=Smallanthus sonchifolius TaxID=185202 RepID=A0ACB9IXU3_9ASTR|nr:hypothetical protein L1987_17213 [Smallanthus sonchifolius]